MLEFKSWYKQRNRNQKYKGCKGGEMFSHFSSFIILPPLCWEKIDLKNIACGKWVITLAWSSNNKNLGESFAWQHE